MKKYKLVFEQKEDLWYFGEMLKEYTGECGEEDGYVALMREMVILELISKISSKLMLLEDDTTITMTPAQALALYSFMHEDKVCITDKRRMYVIRLIMMSLDQYAKRIEALVQSTFKPISNNNLLGE